MNGPRVLVLTPTYEECDNLPHFVESVWRVLPEADILVIDDASPDGTGQLAERMAIQNPRLAVLHRAAKLGLGSAYVAGFRYSLEHGYDVTFEMDTDLSHDARHLPSFLAEIAAGADVVVGSRSVAGGGVVGWGMGRRLLSAGGSLYARAILGAPVHDMTTGYKAYSRRALEAIGVDRLRTSGYAFQIETTFRALRAGLRVVEVPIVFLDRRVGRSKLSREVFLEAVWAVWRLRFEKAPPSGGDLG